MPPRKEEKVAPRSVERPLKVNASGKYDKIPEDLQKEQANGDVPLERCSVCGRTFRKDRLESHQNVCAKMQDGAARRGKFFPSKVGQHSEEHLA